MAVVPDHFRVEEKAAAARAVRKTSAEIATAAAVIMDMATTAPTPLHPPLPPTMTVEREREEDLETLPRPDLDPDRDPIRAPVQTARLARLRCSNASRSTGGRRVGKNLSFSKITCPAPGLKGMLAPVLPRELLAKV